MNYLSEIKLEITYLYQVQYMYMQKREVSINRGKTTVFSVRKPLSKILHSWAIMTKNTFDSNTP